MPKTTCCCTGRSFIVCCFLSRHYLLFLYTTYLPSSWGLQLSFCHLITSGTKATMAKQLYEALNGNPSVAAANTCALTIPLPVQIQESRHLSANNNASLLQLVASLTILPETTSVNLYSTIQPTNSTAICHLHFKHSCHLWWPNFYSMPHQPVPPVKWHNEVVTCLLPLWFMPLTSLCY